MTEHSEGDGEQRDDPQGTGSASGFGLLLFGYCLGCRHGYGCPLGGGGGVGSIQILYSGGVLLLGVVTTGDISMRFPLRPSLLL